MYSSKVERLTDIAIKESRMEKGKMKKVKVGEMAA